MPPKGFKLSYEARANIAAARKNQASAIIGRYGVTQEMYDDAMSKGLRWCRDCKKFLPPHEFYGKDARCIECGKARSKRWRDNRSPIQKDIDNDYLSGWRSRNPNSTQKYRLAKYDVTAGWYADKMVEQDNRCAVCGRERPEKKDFCVDHNHTTDEARGLLCQRCNIFIGMLENGLLGKALEYLKRYGVIITWTP
jgi:hypothetical protein